MVSALTQAFHLISNMEKSAFSAYLASLWEPLTPKLQELEKRAIEGEVPIIRKDTQRFLIWLIRDRKPRRILEIGAAVGFSSILMATEAGENADILTMENYEPRIAEAKKNIAEFGMENRITLREGDAGETLNELVSAVSENEGKFNLIFLDGPKGQYPLYLPLLKKLLAKDGILVTDNILQDGDLLRSHFAIRRRDRTIHKRMREYLYELTHDPALSTVILELGDGLSLTTWK